MEIGEAWKEVEGYGGAYQVSNKGLVRSTERKVSFIDGRERIFKGKVLKSNLNTYGYPKVVLVYNRSEFTINVHRLVALAFIPNPENKPQVNHINGIKTDNRVENLEWSTNSENQRHARKIGLNFSRLTESDVLKIRNSTQNTSWLADKFKVSARTIRIIITRKSWVHI